MVSKKEQVETKKKKKKKKNRSLEQESPMTALYKSVKKHGKK